MSTFYVCRFSLLALSAAVASNALALDPVSIDAGPFKVVPVLELEQRYDDNIYSQSTDEVDSWVSVLAPSVTAIMDTGPKKLSLMYQNTTGLYSESSDDNYNDNLLTADYMWELNSRNQFDFKASYTDTHEDRGTGFSQGAAALAISEPDTYTETGVGGKYTYGSDSARGRLVLSLENFDKEYTNHRDTTRGRDRENLNSAAKFLWRVGGKTDAVVEVRQSNTDYTNDPAKLVGGLDTLDSTGNKYFVGVDWEATAKTQGSLRVGHATKDFDDKDRNDFSGSNWELGVSWSPRTYSVISLTTARDARETNGQGDFIDSESYGLTWQHEWSDRFKTTAFWSLDTETYEGDPAGREDDTTTMGARVDYSLLRWVDLGLSVTNSEKDSSNDSFSYDRNQVALHLLMSL